MQNGHFRSCCSSDALARWQALAWKNSVQTHYNITPHFTQSASVNVQATASWDKKCSIKSPPSKFSCWYSKNILDFCNFSIFSIIYQKLLNLTYHDDSYSSSYISNNCDGWFFLGNQHWSMAIFFYFFFYRGRKKKKKEGLYNLLQAWKCQLCMGHHRFSKKWGDNCSNYYSVAGKSTKILILFFFKLSEEVLTTCRERHAGTTSSISLLKPKLGFHAMKFCWHSYRSHPRSARIPCQGLWHWSGSTQSQLSSAY